MVKAALITGIFSVLFAAGSSAGTGEPSAYFQNSYPEARALFLKNISHLKAEIPALEHGEYKIPSSRFADLVTDSLYLPPKSGRKERLLILISGIHGIEGFTGSALQNAFLAENFFNQKDEGLGLLLIHALNPYGFKQKRRVSENNVDLNRNFETSSELFKIKNPGYRKMNSLLNPSEPAHSGWGDRLKFYFQCVKALLQYSMDSLRRAILKGQYEIPRGIYFGGQEFEPQKELMENLLLKTAPGYSQVLLVDLHTGYGERGRLHLFADRTPAMDENYLAQLFAGHPLDFAQKKDFYEATGGLVVYAAKLLEAKTRYAGIVFEFGTLDSQKTLGSLDSLYRMVRENQIMQQGARSEEDRQEIAGLFSEMFYPSDSAWRASALDQFRETLSLALKNQKALK